MCLTARAHAASADGEVEPVPTSAGGQGVPQDLVAAYMWLSLAAAQPAAADLDAYVEARDAVARSLRPNASHESGSRHPNRRGLSIYAATRAFPLISGVHKSECPVGDATTAVCEDVRQIPNVAS